MKAQIYQGYNSNDQVEIFFEMSTKNFPKPVKFLFVGTEKVESDYMKEGIFHHTIKNVETGEKRTLVHDLLADYVDFVTPPICLFEKQKPSEAIHRTPEKKKVSRTLFD